MWWKGILPLNHAEIHLNPIKMASKKSNHYDVNESDHWLQPNQLLFFTVSMFTDFRAAFFVSLALIFKLSKDAVLKH